MLFLLVVFFLSFPISFSIDFVFLLHNSQLSWGCDSPQLRYSVSPGRTNWVMVLIGVSEKLLCRLAWNQMIAKMNLSPSCCPSGSLYSCYNRWSEWGRSHRVIVIFPQTGTVEEKPWHFDVLSLFLILRYGATWAVPGLFQIVWDNNGLYWWR